MRQQRLWAILPATALAAVVLGVILSGYLRSQRDATELTYRRRMASFGLERQLHMGAAIQMAARRGDLDTFRHFARGYPHEDMQMQEAFEEAVMGRHRSIVDYWFQQRWPFIMREGATPLDRGLALAARNSDTAMVSLLLAHGANVRCGERTGWSALAQAAELPDPAVVRILLRAGADKDAAVFDLRHLPGQPYKNGWSPLMLAANAGRTATVRELLARGAETGRRAEFGETAISLASAAGHDDITELILAASNRAVAASSLASTR